MNKQVYATINGSIPALDAKIDQTHSFISRHTVYTIVNSRSLDRLYYAVLSNIPTNTKL